MQQKPQEFQAFMPKENIDVSISTYVFLFIFCFYNK